MTKAKSKLPLVIVGVGFAVVAVVVIPQVVTWASRRIYQSRNDLSEINFDDMGPEIVRKDKLPKDEV